MRVDDGTGDDVPGFVHDEAGRGLIALPAGANRATASGAKVTAVVTQNREDGVEDGFRYLMSLAHGLVEERLVRTLVETGPRVMQRLEEATPEEVARFASAGILAAFRDGALLGYAIAMAHHTDIGGHIIPALTANGVAHLYDFSTNEVPGQDQREKGYWRDVGTIDAYWEANIDLTAVEPKLDMYDTEWPIWTYQAQLPPAKFVFDSEDRRGKAEGEGGEHTA